MWIIDHKNYLIILKACFKFKKKQTNIKRNPDCVVVNVLDSKIEVSEFKLQSCYYVHFRIDTLEKKYGPPYPPCYVV